MAKKFSLKDNPIFQRLEAPEPREPEPPTEEALPSQEVSRPPDPQKPPDEGHNLTLINRSSNIDPQVLSFTELPEQGANVTTTDAPAQSPEAASPSQDLGLKDHLDNSLFFSFFNEMVDELLPTLHPTEQVLYIRLFRLSYGFNRNYCTVSQSLLIERRGFSRNTVRTSVQSLAQKGWIRVVEAGNRVSTTYRVVLPREKASGDQNSRANLDPHNLTLMDRASKDDGQTVSRKIRGSEIDPHEGQNLALQQLTLGKRPLESAKEPDTCARGSDVEGQELTP